MNHVLKAVCVVASSIVTLSASAEVLTDQDFRTVIHTVGSDVWPTITGNNKSRSMNNAFDGVRFSSDTNERWLTHSKLKATRF